MVINVSCYLFCQRRARRQCLVLTCHLQGPSICGEQCPGTKFCQQSDSDSSSDDGPDDGSDDGSGSGSGSGSDSFEGASFQDESPSSPQRREARHGPGMKGLRDSGPDNDGMARPLLPRVLDQSKTWELSAISVPPGELWEGNEAWLDTALSKYSARYHASAGAGQQVYMYDHGVPWATHSEFAANRPEVIPLARYGGRKGDAQSTSNHASNIAARLVGRELGVAKRAKVWAFGISDPGSDEKLTLLGGFRAMEAYVRILEHVASNGWGTRSVFTTSSSFGSLQSAHPLWEAVRNIMGTFAPALRSGGHHRLTSRSQCVRRAGKSGRCPHAVGGQRWQREAPLSQFSPLDGRSRGYRGCGHQGRRGGLVQPLERR